MKLTAIPNTDLRLSALCYGGGAWGTDIRGKAMDKLINTFRDAGGNFFDTAHCYACWKPGGAGLSEIALGDYFRRNGGEKMIIATKGGHPTYARYRTVDRYLSPGRIEADIDDSLARLGFDTIDLYWLHRDDLRVPVREIMDTLNREVRRGRIRYLGASNWTTARIAEANAYARAHRLRGFVATQPEWSLAKPNAKPRAGALVHFHNNADSKWCREQGFPVIPYTPTARGYFASNGQSARGSFDNAQTRTRLKQAQTLARQLGYTPNQVALAYLINQPFPVIPILGTSKMAHLRDAIGALDLRLGQEQITYLLRG